jgi:hypothetical protein
MPNLKSGSLKLTTIGLLEESLTIRILFLISLIKTGDSSTSAQKYFTTKDLRLIRFVQIQQNKTLAVLTLLNSTMLMTIKPTSTLNGWMKLKPVSLLTVHKQWSDYKLFKF